MLFQKDGLKDGQRMGSLKNGKIPLSEEQIDIIVYQADLNDLIPAFQASLNNNSEQKFFLKKECSGFVRYNNKTKNLITAHTTHNIYSLMNRIYKYYDFNFIVEGINLNNFKFSSRPGDLNSKDDYYILSNGMSIIETSLEIFNLELFKNLSPDTVPKWIRINIANRLAKNNSDWIEKFFKYNSGTHNNQWILVDYNQFETFIEKDSFENKIENPKNIIHLVEQIPILDKAYFQDVSEMLINEGYVASYNAPFFEETINLAGYKNSSHADYFSANRYFLFKKLNKDADSVENIQKLMEYHDIENMCDTIAPRCDIVENFAFGSVDGKITDREMIRKMISKIKYGPPFIKGISTPFNFSGFKNVSHLGIPEYFNFKWIIS